MPSKLIAHGSGTGILSLIIVLTVGFVAVFSPILSPFLLGLAWAYMYQPLMQRCVSFGIKRTVAALILTIVTYGLLAIVIGVLLPVVRKVSYQLSTHFPDVRNQIVWSVSKTFQAWGPDMQAKAQEVFDAFLGQGAQWAGNALVYLFHNSLILAQVLGTVLISPIIAFHFLRDWQPIWDRLFALVPRQYRSVALSVSQECHQSLAHYVRGQMGVCLVLALYYSTALTLLGLRHAVPIGILTGLLIWIPYIGMICGVSTACILTLIQFADPSRALVTCMIYGVGQALESFIFTPFLIGKKTGLHPLWVLFALFAGAFLKGFSGVLMALPVATLLAALWRVLRKRYMESAFFQDKWPSI